MKNILSLSKTEFKELAIKLSDLTYIERIRILFDEYGEIRGETKLNISKKEYIISTKPQTEEENLQRWKYFLEKKSDLYFTDWQEKNITILNKSDDPNKAITHLLNKIKADVHSNHLIKNGYEYGFFPSSLDWINAVSISFDHQAELSNWAKGYSLYKAERLLKKVYDNEPEVGDEIPSLGLLSIRAKITLAYKLGIIEHLEKFNVLNSPKTLSLTLSLLFGINQKSADYENLHNNIKKLKAGDSSKSPINTKNIRDIENKLREIGFNSIDLRQLKK